MNSQTKRNGTVELLRFLFCMVVVFYHIHNRTGNIFGKDDLFFANGRLGVEFFFLLSGILMAKHAHKHFGSPHPVSETTLYMKNKLFQLLPYHLVIFPITLICVLAINPLPFDGVLTRLLEYLPNFMLLQKSGLNARELLTPEWYLAAMLVAMLPLYYLTVRCQTAFTKIWCPLLAMVIVCYIMQATGGMSKLNTYLVGGAVSKAYLRAFAELALGEFCFEIASWLKRLRLKWFCRSVMTLVEIICYVTVLVFTTLAYERSYDANMLLLLAIGLTLTFSEQTYLRIHGSVVSWLGKMSLPIYMFSALPLTLMYQYPASWSREIMILVAILTTVLPAIPYHYLCKALDKVITKKRAALHAQESTSTLPPSINIHLFNMNFYFRMYCKRSACS